MEKRRIDLPRRRKTERRAGNSSTYTDITRISTTLTIWQTGASEHVCRMRNCSS